MQDQRLTQLKSCSWMIWLVFILSIFPITSSAQNKVVVIPLGGDSLSKEQSDILEFFSYDDVNDRILVKGVAGKPVNEILFQDMNVRGASQVRQNSTTNGTDIPANSIFAVISEQTLTLGSEPQNRQAVVAHAFANIDSSGGVTCACEFRGYLWQDRGLPTQIRSLPVHLEVEAGDNDIDATISHTFAFIATSKVQSYSFEVQLFADVADPADGFYKVDEAGITLTTFGLAGTGVLKMSGNDASNAKLNAGEASEND